MRDSKKPKMTINIFIRKQISFVICLIVIIPNYVLWRDEYPYIFFLLLIPASWLLTFISNYLFFDAKTKQYDIDINEYKDGAMREKMEKIAALKTDNVNANIERYKSKKKSIW